MKNIIQGLLEIQKVDLTIIENERSVQNLPKQKILMANKINELEKKVVELVASKTSIETQKNQTEGALKINTDRLVRSKTRESEISNMNELNALKREIDALEKQKIVFDERVGKILDQFNEVEKTIAETTEQINGLKIQLSSEENESEKCSKEILQVIADLKNKKSALAKAFDETILKKYDRISKVRNGLAVTRVAESRCQGCRMTLPPNLISIVKTNKTLQTCPHCSRFLYDENVVKD